jgi:2-amino-4-hydroxy-6-hydroxymethyldihydropteridine diphosphokinase
MGSNLGDRLAYLTQAVRLLADGEAARLVATSSVYETAPQGKTDQPAFLNIVVAVATDLEPEALLAHMLHAERHLKRVRTERWGPRTIDIDLLLYGGAHLDTPSLTVPHPRMGERAFVLIPLLEIAPELPYRHVLAALPDQGVRRYLDGNTFLTRIQGVK